MDMTRRSMLATAPPLGGSLFALVQPAEAASPAWRVSADNQGMMGYKGKFTLAYADQAEQDHATLKAAAGAAPPT